MVSDKISIAVIVCVYKNDSILQFEAAMDSIFIACSFNVNVYLHIDGEIGEELENAISKYNFYKIVKSEVNVGLAKGLNKLLDSIESEKYIFRMDADDISIPYRFEKQVNFMEGNLDIDIAGAAISEFIGNPNNIVAEREYPASHPDIVNMMIKASPIGHVTCCFRTSFINKTHARYPTNFPLNEDIAMWYHCLELKAIFGNLDERLVLVRMDGAYSRRSLKKSFHEARVYFKICRNMNVLPFYPIIRFLFRLLPIKVVKFIYNSSFRRKFLG